MTSRQRRWQRKMAAEGRCVICGEKVIGKGKSPRCEKHAEANRVATRKWWTKKGRKKKKGGTG